MANQIHANMVSWISDRYLDIQAVQIFFMEFAKIKWISLFIIIIIRLFA